MLFIFFIETARCRIAACRFYILCIGVCLGIISANYKLYCLQSSEIIFLIPSKSRFISI